MYGSPLNYYRWLIQVAEWVFSTVVGRAVAGAVIVLGHGAWDWIANGVDEAFPGRETLELYVVMVCWPLFVNLVQALVQDQVLKWKSSYLQVA